MSKRQREARAWTVRAHINTWGCRCALHTRGCSLWVYSCSTHILIAFVRVRVCTVRRNLTLSKTSFCFCQCRVAASRAGAKLWSKPAGSSTRQTCSLPPRARALTPSIRCIWRRRVYRRDSVAANELFQRLTHVNHTKMRSGLNFAVGLTEMGPLQHDASEPSE